MDNLIITITGHSGAGKSTLIAELVRRLDDVTSLSLDDYQATSTYPPVRQWLDEGADPNQFVTPDFVTDVRRLVNGESILHPVTKARIQPARYLVLEEHFGRGRGALRDLIDFVILIEVPLEIAQARKLLRKNDFLPWEDDSEVFIKNLQEQLHWYLRVGRDFYVAVDEIVRKDCDLIVDGSRPASQVADEVVNAILKRIS